MKKTIQSRILESFKIKEVNLNYPHLLDQLKKLSPYCLNALHNGGKIIIAGYGGSFVDSEYLKSITVSSLTVPRYRY